MKLAAESHMPSPPGPLLPHSSSEQLRDAAHCSPRRLVIYGLAVVSGAATLAGVGEEVRAVEPARAFLPEEDVVVVHRVERGR
jgi:hypothetical protein